VYDKLFYSITAREIILEWDKTACRFVFSYWTWTCLFWRGLGLEDRGLGLGCCWTCYKSDTTSWDVRWRTQVGDATDQLRDQRWSSLACGPKQPRLKSGPLCGLGYFSTDGLSVLTIHVSQPAEAGDFHWVGQTSTAFGWSHRWSLASPAWVRRPAARRTHWTFDVKTVRCDL